MTAKYMIRNKEGLYSTGGMDPRFTRKGKVWNGIGPLKCHLVMMKSCSYYGVTVGKVYKDCVVVEIAMKAEEVSAMSVLDFIQQDFDRRAKEQDRLEKRYEAEAKERRHEEYLKLKEEFDGTK